jgi:hypothetical protein
MKRFIKTMVAASAMLAMLGCSRDWPFTPNEDGKVVIEGGDPDEPPPVYPATIYGTLEWGYQGPAIAVVVVYDDNGVCIAKTHEMVSDQGGYSYNLCECPINTESPLPWTIYAAAYDEGYDTWRMDSEVITSLDTWYTCPGGGLGIRKKAKQVNLDLYYPSLPDTTNCYECD